MRIPFKKINTSGAKKAVNDLLDSGRIGLGDTVYQFEKELAQYVGAPYVVAVDSCTSALFLSLIWERKQKRLDPVLTIPSMTVPLVACAIKEAEIDFAFTSDTNWVGSEYQIGGSQVFDSAHELRFNQFFANTHGQNDKVCFSFYPTKTIGSADGGAIATGDADFAKWARQISTYGRNQQTHYGNSWDYDVEMFGYKRHWTNLQAAIALEQLMRLDRTANRRIEIRDKYNRAFVLDNHSEYLYRIDVQNRDQFIDKMADEGIECGVHFKPLHLMTPFVDIQMTERAKEKVEEKYKTTVSLPFFDTMTDYEVDDVITAVLKHARFI